MITKTTKNYLDDVLKNYPSVKNDNQLAMLIGITRQAVSQYKNGQNMSVLVAIKLATLLGLDPMETVSATMLAQCKSDEEKIFWSSLYERSAKFDS